MGLSDRAEPFKLGNDAIFAGSCSEASSGSNSSSYKSKSLVTLWRIVTKSCVDSSRYGIRSSQANAH